MSDKANYNIYTLSNSIPPFVLDYKHIFPINSVGHRDDPNTLFTTGARFERHRDEIVARRHHVATIVSSIPCAGEAAARV